MHGDMSIIREVFYPILQYSMNLARCSMEWICGLSHSCTCFAAQAPAPSWSYYKAQAESRVLQDDG